MISKNVTINGRRTSLRLEEEIWNAVDDTCQREGLSVHQLFTLIDTHRHGVSRTSAVRSFIVGYLRALAPMNGTQRKGIALSILSEKISGRHAA
ncbi:MAG: ribbon-helix-helix domain-containing protein [Rhodospirillales bacterium]|nr:ribbon-helix-helix domain-containing protein [Rhodospirillales bacterium]